MIMHLMIEEGFAIAKSKDRQKLAMIDDALKELIAGLMGCVHLVKQ